MKLNKALKVLFVSNAVFIFAGTLLGPLYAVYVQKLGGGVLAISTSWAVFLVASTVFTILVSKLASGIKEMRTLFAIGFLVRALAWFAYIFVGSITGLLLIQALLGLGEALGTPSFGVLLNKHLDKKVALAELSEWQIMSNLVVAGATLVGGWLVSMSGFNYLFGVMAGFAVLSFLLIWLTPKEVL